MWVATQPHLVQKSIMESAVPPRPNMPYIFTYTNHYCAIVPVPTSNYPLNFYLQIFIQHIFLSSCNRLLHTADAFQPRCIRIHVLYFCRISSQARSRSRKKRLLLLPCPSVFSSLHLFTCYHPNSLEVIPTLMQWRVLSG